MLKLGKETKSYSFVELAKDAWFFLGEKKARFLFFSFFLILAQLGSFAVAYLLGQVVDFFVNQETNFNKFYFLVAGIGFVGAMEVWLKFFGKWRVQEIGAEIRMKTRIMALEKLMDIELKEHEKEDTGSKIQKISSGGENLNRVFDLFANEGVNILTGIGGSLIIFLFLDLEYLLFAFIYLFIYFSGEYYFDKRISKIQDEMNLAKEKVSGRIHESASNLLTVKSLGLKSALVNSSRNYEQEFLDIWKKNKTANQLKTKTIKMFSALGYALFILLVGLDVKNGLLSVGAIITLSGYFGKLKASMRDTTNNLGRFIEVKSGVGRMMTILDKKTLERESASYKEIDKDWKKISFKEVFFKYKGKWIIENFNLEVKRGEKIGIVGVSGSGKSTLIKLLLNLYNPQKGRIEIGGIELEKAKKSSINSKITAVLQDSEMFNMPLKENISIVSGEKLDNNKLKKAIELSALEEVVKKLPNGADTLIGEKGYKLSGGERQRLGFARAIYKDSDIFILDEATSALDSKTEIKIQEAINKNLNDKTIFVIAHRLSTLRNVDRIIVLAEGKIKEEGKFEDLIKKKGYFYELWKKQVRD